jgi:dinuclear metal center YbgI/SA1388 family protein
LPAAPARGYHVGMNTLEQIIAALDQYAPRRLAEEWDNVGLLVGDRKKPVARVMTCLTVTPASAAEAVERRADLIVTHHPLPFRPLRRLTTDSTEGRMLLELIAAGVAVYSAHTAFDSAADGINQKLAAGLGLTDIAPLLPDEASTPEQPIGGGRCGRPAEPTTLGALAERLKTFLSIDGLHRVGEPDQAVTRVAVACGGGGEFLAAALHAGCDCLVTGEARFHACLEAEANRLGMLLPGHYASERFALEHWAAWLAQQFPDLEVWPSRRESDPLRWT